MSAQDKRAFFEKFASTTKERLLTPTKPAPAVAWNKHGKEDVSASPFAYRLQKFQALEESAKKQVRSPPTTRKVVSSRAKLFEAIAKGESPVKEWSPSPNAVKARKALFEALPHAGKAVLSIKPVPQTTAHHAVASPSPDRWHCNTLFTEQDSE
ncbi:hypothetical protein WJX72_007000 [[Myrmecia] bisecta]|uniref:Uncharacterized protein n=1 Tax=[Myrmecia] bisecta TaxID=41462 RepID=A0AAW1P5W5_9CHLO